MPARPLTYRGKTALITGASTGIGAQFARDLAARGCSLVLVARSKDALDQLAAELRESAGVDAAVIAADLTAPTAAADLIEHLDARGLEVDYLINNAGFGTFGDLADADPDRIDEEVRLNVSALTAITTRFVPRLVGRDEAALVTVASNAAFQPIPHMAVYAATKAYVLSFTRAVWGETRGTSLRVLAVCPGPTQTPFFAVAGEDKALTRRRTTAQVTQTALRALDAGKPSVVDGVWNAFVARVGARLAPERALIAAAGRFVRPRA